MQVLPTASRNFGARNTIPFWKGLPVGPIHLKDAFWFVFQKQSGASVQGEHCYLRMFAEATTIKKYFTFLRHIVICECLLTTTTERHFMSRVSLSAFGFLVIHLFITTHWQSCDRLMKGHLKDGANVQKKVNAQVSVSNRTLG